MSVIMDKALSKEEAFAELSKLTRTFHDHHGLLVPEFIQQEYIDSISSLPLDPTDVFISTYPKAGTTWTQQIVKLLRNKGESDEEKIDVDMSIPWLESAEEVFKVIDFNAMPKPRAFKSHMTYELMPCGEPRLTPCKYIYVARNPKDVAVSMYFHYGRFHVKQGMKLDWSLYLRNFLFGNVEFGDFFNHVLSWWAHKDDDNVLFLKFEDMKKDLATAITKIANFIGADLSDEIVSKVAEKTTFKAMKADNTANKTWCHAKPGSTDFMRKGEVGDWMNYFTPEHSAEMDRLCTDRLKGTGLEFTFEM